MRIALFCFWMFSTACVVLAQDGAALYNKHCASCHDSSGATQAPNRSALRQLSPERIAVVLEEGVMRDQGLERTPTERRAIAEFLSDKPYGSEPADTMAAEAACQGAPASFADPLAGPNWNGWGANLSNTRFQTPDMAGLSAGQVPRLKLKWAFGFPGDIRAYAQPTIAGGRVFVGSAGRRVYSLDAATGCVYWVVKTDSPVRTAISIGPLAQRGTRQYAAYWGDSQANVYAADVANGKLLWKTQVDDHTAARITGAPQLHAGRLYVPVSSLEELSAGAPTYECCTFRGSVVALDAESGEQIWKTYTIAQTPRSTGKNKVGVQLWGPSGAAIWSAPTLDLQRDVIYVATGDNYSDPPTAISDAILALDMDSGKILWFRQMTAGDAWNLACREDRDEANCPESDGPDFDFGSSPILVELSGGRRALVIGQKSGIVHALDPDREGEILWQRRVGKGGTLGGIQWGSAADEQKVYVALSDIAFRWSGSTREPDPKVGGGLFALRLATGEQEWYSPPPACPENISCSPAQSAAVTAIPGVVFSGSIDGHLRAYSMKDGKILWDFDTLRRYETVNRVEAQGGSLNGPGATVAGGMLFINSGYGGFGGKPRNVLLAFSVGDE